MEDNDRPSYGRKTIVSINQTALKPSVVAPNGNYDVNQLLNQRFYHGQDHESIELLLVFTGYN